jgi:cobalamin biosynthesis protein CobT
MRNKHLELRRRIEDAKLKITDAELFASRLYASVLSDIAETVSHRFRRKCKVFVFWDDAEGAMAACTNNRQIKINAGNFLTRSFPTRKLKDLSLRGMLGHELGHILYTDFNMAKVYNAKLAVGEFYPALPTPDDPIEESYLDEIEDYLRDHDRAAMIILRRAANEIDNILEDVYIEARMSDRFPGTFAQGIALNNVRFADLMPSVADQVAKSAKGYSIVVNLMIQYCKAGDINNLTKARNEYLDMLYKCIPMIDTAVYDDDGKVRYAATNHLLVRLWPYLRKLRDEVQEQIDKGLDPEAAESELGDTLDGEVCSGPPMPSCSGKPVKDSGEPDPEELSEERQKAQEVLDEETGRMAPMSTDTISTGEGGAETENEDYKGAGNDKAASDIERVLSKMAEARVCSEEEAALTEELQSEADRINYGNAHEGVDVRINRIRDVPDEMIEQYESICEPLIKLSKRLQKQVLQVIRDQRNGGRETGLLMGHRILTRSLYHEDGHIFYKNRLPQDKAELAVALLVDESGSMSSCDRITIARAAAIVVYDFCKSLGIPVLVQGHSSGGSNVDMYSYAEFDAKDKNDCYRMMDMSARWCNRDGAALRYTAERLAHRPEEVKLLILISDGQPAADGYYGTAAEADLRSIKREYSNRGITMFAAAIGEDKENIERIYGDGFLDVSKLDDLPSNLTRLIADRIKRKRA